jgi:hypothetical protein
MALRIPEQHHSTIRRLDELDRPSVDAIVAAIETCKPTFLMGAFVKALSKRAGLTRDEAEAYIEVLVAFYVARDSVGLAIGSFLDQLVYAAKTQITDGDEGSPRSWEGLRRNLRRLLALDKPLGVSAKALGVMTDHANIFRNARIISDLRPVFGSDPVRTPVAATIVHTLKIQFNEKGGGRAFFVALDTNDLKRLRSVVERALIKDRALRRFITTSELSFLDAQSLKGN